MAQKEAEEKPEEQQEEQQEEQPEMRTREVTIMSLAGEMGKLSVPEDSTLDDLMTKIAKTFGIPVVEQRLLLDGDQLMDTRKAIPQSADGAEVELLLVRRTKELLKWLAQLDKLSKEKVRGWLREAHEDIQGSREVVYAAVCKDAHALESAPAMWQADRDIVLRAMKQNPQGLAFAAKELKADREIVLESVAQDGFALYYASPELRADPEVARVAIGQTMDAFRAAGRSLQEDREFVLSVVQKHPGLYPLLGQQTLREDRDIVIAALEIDKDAWKLIPESLREDAEVCAAHRKPGVMAQPQPEIG